MSYGISHTGVKTSPKETAPFPEHAATSRTSQNVARILAPTLRDRPIVRRLRIACSTPLSTLGETDFHLDDLRLDFSSPRPFQKSAG
jgi:hypothetical protein